MSLEERIRGVRNCGKTDRSEEGLCMCIHIPHYVFLADLEGAN